MNAKISFLAFIIMNILDINQKFFNGLIILVIRYKW